MDSSRNLQANYVIRFLFRLDLLLHACKIFIRCDKFGILNFATKHNLPTSAANHETGMPADESSSLGAQDSSYEMALDFSNSGNER